MSFKCKLHGRRVSDALFSMIKKAEKLGLHGHVAAIEAVTSPSGAEGFKVTYSNGEKKFRLDVGVEGLLRRDIALEPRRRKAYAAEKALTAHPDQALVAEARRVVADYQAQAKAPGSVDRPYATSDIPSVVLGVVRERQKSGKFSRW